MKLNDEQVKRLKEFAEQHGRFWKQKLSSVWAAGEDANDPILRQIRNGMGASGLKAVSLAVGDNITTPRNNLPIRSAVRDMDYYCVVDALYEIGDAELTSSGDFKSRVGFMRSMARGKGYKREFTAAAKSRLLVIARREGFVVRAVEVNTICDRIFDDWME